MRWTSQKLTIVGINLWELMTILDLQIKTHRYIILNWHYTVFYTIWKKTNTIVSVHVLVLGLNMYHFPFLAPKSVLDPPKKSIKQLGVGQPVSPERGESVTVSCRSSCLIFAAVSHDSSMNSSQVSSHPSIEMVMTMGNLLGIWLNMDAAYCWEFGSI